MILLYASVIVFNILAFKTVRNISINKIVHIWLFTIAFQMLWDVFIDLKYHGYWYITQGIDYIALPAYTILIPPINIMFLNWFPFKVSLIKRMFYIGIWLIFMLMYELLASLPEPWGYYRYGWWKFLYSCFFDLLLLMILLGYYKWICKLEKKVILSSK